MSDKDILDLLKASKEYNNNSSKPEIEEMKPKEEPQEEPKQEKLEEVPIPLKKFPKNVFEWAMRFFVKKDEIPNDS